MVGIPEAPIEVREEEVTTGRTLVLLDRLSLDNTLKELSNSFGISVEARSSETKDLTEALSVASSSGLVLDSLGVAIVHIDPDQSVSVASREKRPYGVLAVEGERYVQVASSLPPLGMEHAHYVSGYRDAVVALTDQLLGVGGIEQRSAERWSDTNSMTWGLRAIRADATQLTGRGVGLAILDTGLDKSHPEVGRKSVAEQSFVPGEGTNDIHGHGTHCVGIAAGPRADGSPLSYGVAPECDVLVAKVLSATGRGVDADVLTGLEWAMRSGARIVSMSLGARTLPGQSHSVVFEGAARVARDAGVVIVAAAGNDSRRGVGQVAPVAHPANCPSVLAVGAVDNQLQVAPFSNGSTAPPGGRVALSAPGTRILSSFVGGGHAILDGTSMATPFVAGVLALLAERHPDGGADELVGQLLSTSRPLGSPADYGAGLVQAPI